MAKKRSKTNSSSRGKKKATSRRGAARSNSPWAKASKKAKSSKKSAGSKKKTGKKKSARRKPGDPMQRLQRVMAAAGIGSRRECETIIEEGRVEVDGEIVVTLGSKVAYQQRSFWPNSRHRFDHDQEPRVQRRPPRSIKRRTDSGHQ
jgi:23S rRNA pseudouridine2605 synthase